MALIANLRGTPGTPGSPGAPGSAGKDGATWLNGSGVPSNAIGKDGDFYLNSDNGDVYKKAAGSWV